MVTRLTAGATTAIVSGSTLPALPMRDGSITLDALVMLRMQRYAGRDTALPARLEWWQARLGARRLDSITDDDVHAALEALALEPARYFVGWDADGRAIYKAKRQQRKSPATLNRYFVALQSLLTWAIKQRIAPKGFVHPCAGIPKRTEPAGKTRFLDRGERERLLAAAARSKWDRLHLLVLLALTTGRRKGDLVNLRWRDIDLDARTASVGRTKNGDPAVLPLVPEAVAELRRFQGKPEALVFASRRRPQQPYDFVFPWRDALKVAGIRGFRFHDLRHTCASVLVQKGVPVLQVADLLGHRQLSMTQRYAHLAVEHRAATAARVLDDLPSVV